MPRAAGERSLASTAVAAGVAVAVGAGVGYSLWRLRRRRAAASGGHARRLRVQLLYGSVTGTSERWARSVADELLRKAPVKPVISVEDLATFPFDSLLVAPKPGELAPAQVVVVLMSTQAEGAPPPGCAHFCTLLEDHVHDFRVSQDALAHLRFAVLGFGSVEYEPAGHYCTAAARVDRALGALSARRLLPLTKVTDTEEVAAQMAPWCERLHAVLAQLADGLEPSLAPAAPERRGRAAGSRREAADEGAQGQQEGTGEEDGSDSDTGSTTVGSDVEGEKAVAVGAGGGGSDVEELAESCAGKVHTKEMLTAKHRAQLTKEGYKIVGSHSAVKLCRWTKHQLRGRGGCYKHSFYGITSYQCMEATPSLACANKCVFCWRHHKNPVGTEWKWRMDEPEVIVAEGIEAHRKMIREARGIPGVKRERFEEALNVRHCALSLVGEPIMYPRINEFVADLHRRRISTFLVTNAQFPEAIRSLSPVTQLYVSVDAATSKELKAVDRPLFGDFWERFLDSLRALGEKKQRTTYRLTLMKGQNMTEAADYAKLVSLGQPDFIEIKSVTFCGESKASSLKLEDVPWHEEVKNFAEAMLSHEGLTADYELACEHQHSCIVLLANRRFKIQGQWHTWIDYDRFHDLVAEGRPFEALDYAAPTPQWALYGSQEAGFDPKETRHFHNRTKRRAQAGQLSEAQLRQYPHDPAREQ